MNLNMDEGIIKNMFEKVEAIQDEANRRIKKAKNVIKKLEEIQKEGSSVDMYFLAEHFMLQLSAAIEYVKQAPSEFDWIEELIKNAEKETKTKF